MHLLAGLLALLLHITLFVLSAARNPYDVLGVTRNVDQKDIKRAYKKLARQWHPDRSTNKEAASRFVEVADAYQILSDPTRRKNYDLYGEDSPQRPQQQHPFSGNGESYFYFQSADGSRYRFQGSDPFTQFNQNFFRSKRREQQEPLGHRIWNKILSFDGLTSLVLTMITVGAITGVGALVKLFDEEADENTQPKPSSTSRSLLTDKLVLEMNIQTYYGLLRLQKPGCRTVLLLVDGESESKLLIDQFADAINLYRSSRTLAFAYLDLEKYFHWYVQLLLESGLIGSHTDVQKKQCLGTVLVLNNFKRSFFLFHSKTTEKITKRNDYYGLSSGSDESDVESVLHRKRRNRSSSQLSSSNQNNDFSLDGLSIWLERVFDGQGKKVTVDRWPELTKYG